MTPPEALRDLVAFDPRLSYSINEYHGSKISTADGQRRDEHDWQISAACQGETMMYSGFCPTLPQAVESIKQVIIARYSRAAKPNPSAS